MRRLLLASLAFLLLFLPVQVGSARVMPAMDCCPCSSAPTSAPTCPQPCPAPAPRLACVVTPAPLALPTETEVAAPRAAEPTPAPTFVTEGSTEQSDASLLVARLNEDPPDRGRSQAKLSLFRI